MAKLLAAMGTGVDWDAFLGGPLTANTPFNVKETWNNAAVKFEAFVVDITDTASLSTSTVFDMKVGGVSKFKIDKAGVVTFGGSPAFIGGTVTVDTPMSFTQTWNDGGVTFTGFKIDITDTASAAASKPIDVLVDAASVFSVDKAGKLIVGTSITSTGALTLAAAGANEIAFDTNSLERVRIDATGRLIIGATTGTSILHVESSSMDVMLKRLEDNVGVRTFINFRDTNDLCGAIDVNTTTNTTAYLTSSDERLKFKPSSFDGTAMILAMIPQEYERTAAPGIKEFGFFAQDLFDVLPQAVKPGGDNPSDEPWMIDYGQVSGVLAKAFQEMHARVSTLEAR